MALFTIPVEFEGKTLQQIGDQYGLGSLSGVGRFAGVGSETPLRAGMLFEAPDDPGNAEVQVLERLFKQTSQEELFAEQMTKALKEKIDAETKWVDKYISENPFVFDEELAKRSATAEYQPYYTELLDDYIQDVNKQRQTVQGEQKLLGQLKQLDTGARSRAYQYALENANEGYAGKGLFSSGMRARDIGKQEIEYKAGAKEAEGRYGAQEQRLESTLEGYQTDEERKIRDVGREQQVAVTGGIEQRRGEALKPYLSSYEQAYKRQFQPGSMTSTDYLPSSYLRY